MLATRDAGDRRGTWKDGFHLKTIPTLPWQWVPVLGWFQGLLAKMVGACVCVKVRVTLHPIHRL